jgi:hypothetical protein
MKALLALLCLYLVGVSSFEIVEGTWNGFWMVNASAPLNNETQFVRTSLWRLNDNFTYTSQIIVHNSGNLYQSMFIGDSVVQETNGKFMILNVTAAALTFTPQTLEAVTVVEAWLLATYNVSANLQLGVTKVFSLPQTIPILRRNFVLRRFGSDALILDSLTDMLVNGTFRLDLCGKKCLLFAE